MTSKLLLSPAQQGIYFDAQLREASDYHVGLNLRVRALPPEQVAAAVTAVLSEQPALRSAVRHEAAGPVYVVAEATDAPLTQYDLRDDPSPVDALCDQALHTPFDLAEGPLFRVLHCRLPDEDRLSVVCHHLVADGMSVGILAEQILERAYGAPAADPQPDTGFEAYQTQQANPLPPKRETRQRAYWEESLTRQQAPDLAHWMPPGSDGGIGRELRLPLPPDLRSALRACAREVEVSEYALHVAAFGILLSRYADADHVSVATPFSDRPGLEMSDSVGCFIKTLPVHIDVRGASDVRALLEQVRSEIMETWRNIAYPVTQVLGEHPSLSRVFDITFIQDSYPAYPDGVLGPVRPERVYFPGLFTVLIEHIGESAELVLQYKESALDTAAVQRFAERYLRLLESIPHHLDSPASRLSLLAPHERDHLLDALSQTHVTDWQPTAIGELFLARTSADPSGIAWFDERRPYSHAWAHDAATLLQRRLIEALDGARRPIGILLPRSAELLASVFGAALAGCPYVPLSSGMPQERLDEILRDADVSWVVTTSDADVHLPQGVGRIDLDTWAAMTALREDTRSEICSEPLAVPVQPADTLYIEFTSGSTGKPKGVVISHANVQNTALDLERRFPLGRDDTYMLKTSFTFDIFGTEAYGWLCGEGRLFILEPGQEGDPLALLTAVRRHAITHLNASPTMLRVLLDGAAGRDRAGDLSGLRYVFSGGEALTSDVVERFFALGLPCSLENVYGPTEATMWATHSTVTAADTDRIAPIGTALNDYRVYVVDREDGLCDIELPGEICIAGAGVAEGGYLGRPELNATHFVANPFFDPQTDPPFIGRMYRTGDLGYLRPDGRLAFARRIDRQVKVGGVRMELGEIEQALLRADGVVEAAVLVDDSRVPARLVGFFTGVATVEGIRSALSATLMPQMIPSLLIAMESLPLSPAGKLDRRALLAHLADIRAADGTVAGSGTGSATAQRIVARWRRVLETDAIDEEASFYTQGGNSLSLMRLQMELQDEFGREIRITELLSNHSVAAQTRLLEDAPLPEQPVVRSRSRQDADIAIIGIGMQVPGANDAQTFWRNLTAGEESITFYSPDELRDLGVPESALADPNYVRARGRLDDINHFDDHLFGLSPAEVDATSPQLRVLYECFWHACEDAGYDPRALPGRVGVFAGGNDDFAWYQKALSTESSFGDAYQNFTLATNHFLSTRLSYLFDLRGPSMSALTGCSTSLLTVHLAAQSLRAHECDLAVAGGVTLELPNDGGYRYVDGMMLSPDGHCRPFDAGAAGTVFSNGAALVVLKPLDAALADGDPIYAVIKGSAVGNDGRRKLSYTAPSEDGQYETIRDAYIDAGVEPTSVSYVEAHGTGTLLGDPIEVASLSRAFRGASPGSCVLGSVKGNIGHTDSAAGAVGLAKVALSLAHRHLPGTRNYAAPNPNIDFGSTPFRISATGQAWRGDLLRAGINSFGVGGTNVHMILDEAPAREASEDRPFELFQFSAASPEALDRTSERVIAHLAQHEDTTLGDAARTLRQGRSTLPYRKTLVLGRDDRRDHAEWIERINAVRPTRAINGARTALLFSGQGNQYHRMCSGLLESTSPVGRLFREQMDDLIGMLDEADAAALRDVVHGPEDDGRINQTEWAQFALFSAQYSMAKVLEAQGVRADVLVGHSIGELTAAAVAGVWRIEDAARLVRLRGRLMQAQEPGIMVAANAPVARVRALVADVPDAWIALDNAAERCVIGMTKNAFDVVVQRLEDEGIRGSRVHTSHAFHTPMMAGAAQGFAEALVGVPSQDPSIPIISNRTGRPVEPGEMAAASYWADHITGTVRFTESLGVLLSGGPLFGIELGPGRTLSTFASQDPGKQPDHVFANLLRHPAEEVPDEAYLLAALGRLWSAGLPLGSSAHDGGRRAWLPGYVFDRIPHQQDASVAATPVATPYEAPVEVPTAVDSVSAVQDAFRYVLGYAEVAPDADFFALGGDSLKATSLVAHLKSSVGVDVTVAEVFAAPTPAGLGARFQAAPAIMAMAKAPEAADHPLSAAQARMYLATRMYPEQLTYNMFSATLLRGGLDVERVRQALRKLVVRHEPLRTTYTLRDGEVRQRISPPDADIALPLRFSHGSHQDPDRLASLVTAFVRPFDLAAGPLFRMEIVDGGPEGSLLLFDIHHIVADATSVEVLTRDFSELYSGDVEPLERQYVDYVHHTQTPEHLKEVAASEQSLLADLANAPSSDVFPLDHARGESEPTAGRVETRFSLDQMKAVKALAEAHNATPFMVMLSAWATLFSRYSGHEDLVIGAAVTGRTMSETREMVGMFVNLVPMRLRPVLTRSFTDFLDENRTTVLGALAHQVVPFDHLVERLNLERVAGRNPLFDISFDYHNMDMHGVEIDGVTAQPVDLAPLAVGMDLVITCLEESDGLTIQIDYAANLFEHRSIEALMGHFSALVEHVCAEPATRLDRLGLHSDYHLAAIRSRLVGSPFTPIHDIIARTAERTPNATAIIGADGRRISFAELDAMANAQANHLHAAGLQVGEPVALFTQRDANLLIAQLAVLKAGGCYVALDPTQPAARHERILADMRPRFAFAAAGTPAVRGIEHVRDIRTCMTESLPTFRGPAIRPDDPIYAVYTSGSTGAPKGTTVKHRGVLNLLSDHRERGLFRADDVIICLSDPTFDIFTFESLLPLASGACVHMCPADDQKDAAAIAARIARHGVTHIQVPVSKMAALCDNQRFRAQLPSLRLIVCGGEHFSENLVTLLQRETRARIFNMYGPTETTVTASVKEFTQPGEPVTIGTPLSGTAMWVANEQGMIQPDGVPGELRIAGEGLAIGYRNNPDETRRAFTIEGEIAGVRAYRTGDTGVRLANGEFVVKGRLDHQVKLHGNRVELGEIEKTALRADNVSYAVAAVEDGELVLYHTSRDQTDASAGINAMIAASLPVYMKPQYVHWLPEMPKLPNNKVDRKALQTMHRAVPTPVSTEVRTSPLPAAPPQPAPTSVMPAAGQNHTRSLVMAAWQEVLGHAVRPTDNFFDVGGNSYKLMLVNNRLSEALGVDVPLVSLFENPTPAGLAAALAPDAPTPPTAPDERPAEASGTISLDDLGGFGDWSGGGRRATSRKIAVIGLAGQFPGAADVTQHWENRAQGVVSITRFSRDDLLQAGLDEATLDDPRYVNARGYVEASTFDADFFGYSAREAETMDPQIRLLHETAWHALEDAGYAPGTADARIALFAGSGTNFAWMAGFLNRADNPVAAFEAMTANEKDFLSTRVAYKLNLTGPAVTVQSACSTSLVAIHQAVESLRRGEADLALAGGVALNFPRKEGYAWHEGMIFSRDGVCRPFAASADGTVGGQGCGMVVLKPLEQALDDGDDIYAVVVGSAVNNDGHDKVGYTAPSVRGQEAVIKAALNDAGIEGDAVGYVETHGTGTKLGDPIEYQALSGVYGRGAACALGGVKANIGHLDAAAGVAGFIGAVGVLHGGEIPPMANFDRLNDDIEASGQLYIPQTRTTPTGGVRAAAVSSFGIGGTNAHLILEAAPARTDDRDTDSDEHLLPVSARDSAACERSREQLSDFCRRHSPDLRDVSHSLGRRTEFTERAVAVARRTDALVWMLPSDPVLALDASDEAELLAGEELLTDRSAVAKEGRTVLEEVLLPFDDGLRAAVRRAMTEGAPDNRAVQRLSQFVMRVVAMRVVGGVSLRARPGTDRLLGIAEGYVRGELRIDEAVAALRTGSGPAPTPQPGAASLLNAGPLSASTLRQLLASAWVHGEEVDRARFCCTGRTVPVPGYPFEQRTMISDIRLSDLHVAAQKPVTEGAPPRADAADVLHDAWTEVLGTEPAPDDDFLMSGGDSLAAVHLCSLIEDRAGLRLDVADVFADARYGALRELLAARGTPTGEASGPSATPGAPAASPTSPASPAQKRLYAVCALQADTTAYNLAATYRITGDLDIDRLRAIFRLLVERHDQLRTSFHLEGGALVQRVRDEVPDVVSVVDVSEAEALERLTAEPRAFDLSTAPLMRVEVLVVDGRARYLVIDMHHIIGDQTSLAVLADDFAHALAGDPLAPPPMRYTDYVERMGQWDAEGRFAPDLEFFTGLLAEGAPRLELATGRTPSGAPTFEGARHHLTASIGRDGLVELARQCGATPFATFLAAVTRLLSLYSGQPEFVLGTALSGRTTPGTERTVGMFVNTLPLVVRDASEQTVRDAVADAGHATLRVLSHQDAPFEAVLAALGIHPDENTQPLFDVVFNYVNMGTGELELDGVRLDTVPPGQFRSKYALTVTVAEGADELGVDLEYRTELFDAAFIARMAEQLDRLLTAMAADPDTRVADISLETDEERERRRRVLTAPGPDIDGSLLDLLRSSLTEHADQPALRWEGAEWTYRELDEVTDALAGGLQEHGIGIGDTVACVLDRGPWQVFARLALVKCGAVEVPMDPLAPSERLVDVLADADPDLVLCSDPDALDTRTNAPVLNPEGVRGRYSPVTGLGPDSVLMMIYTSGSTGKPKGTLVTHGGIMSATVSNGYLAYGRGDRVLHLAQYTFDASLLDVYPSVLSGATVVMGTKAHSMDMTLLGDLIRRERITNAFLVTAVFHLLMAEDPTAITGLRTVHVGGESLQTWAARAAFDQVGPGRVFNLYGPTEASIVATAHRLDERPGRGRVPIGRAANHRELFVVHPDGTDLPRGIPGELCVAGPGVVAGYHRRPELTAEKFVDHLGPLPVHAYRTGDRVVLGDDDLLVFVDRIDRQIKHAGNRIELSEIEWAVQDCPGVQEAAVLHSLEGTISTLTCYYTGQPAPSETDLREALVARLPRYMVPQHLISVDSLPLTPNGKVNRQLLAAQATRLSPAEPVSTPVPVGTPTLVLGVFREVLGQPTLGGGDDLFFAGAQSIQAIAVVRELRDRGVEVQVSDVHRHPTADGLAAALSPSNSPADGTARMRPRRPLAPERLRTMVTWAVADSCRAAESLAGSPSAVSVPAGAVTRLHEASGSISGGFIHRVNGVAVEDLLDAMTTLVGRHEVLRARLSGGQLEIVDTDAVADLSSLLTVSDLRRVDVDQVAGFVHDVALELQEAPFGEGLLWRCVVVVESNTSLRMIWAFHHGVFDGFSAGILRDELPRLARGEDPGPADRYTRFLAALDAPSDWSDELSSFDHATWLRANHELTAALSRHLAGGAPGRRRVPLDGAHPLDVALRLVHAELASITGAEEVSVGFVGDCRRWRTDDFTRCVGEFLDAIPVTLRADADHVALTDRLAAVRSRGLHFVHALDAWAGGDDTVDALAEVYRRERLAMVLVNFQGHIEDEDMPADDDSEGATLALAHLNVWHDDDHLSLAWIIPPASAPQQEG